MAQRNQAVFLRQRGANSSDSDFQVKFQRWEREVLRKIQANKAQYHRSGVIPQEAQEGRLKSLELLKLVIDNGEFEENAKLDLSDLFIEGWIIQEFGLNLKNIKALNLSGNQITALPDDFLNGCEIIQELDVSYNKITYLPNGFLNGCKNIQFLHLHGNQIASLPNDLLNKCKHIKFLHLQGNQIASLPNELLYECKYIQSVQLSGNDIEFLPNDFLNGCKHIKYVDLSNNKIPRLPLGFKQFNDNIDISLSGNPLVSPPLEVCERGIRAIKRYFEDIAKSVGEESKRLNQIRLEDTLTGTARKEPTSNEEKAKESYQADVSQARMIFPTDKIALVIGNQNYKEDEHDNLELALNDASDIASALSKLDFKLMHLTDLTLKEMRIAMLDFSSKLGFGMFAVFYYAGHGFELEGENYLMPVDIQNTNRDSCIRAQEYLQEMQICNTSLNLVILDCCRSRAQSFDVAPKPSLKRFLKGNTIIAYACCTQHSAKEEPNQKNGLYAKYLLKHIHQDTRIENILMEVNSDVMRCQPDMQRPTFESDTGYACRLTAPVKPEMHFQRERRHLWQEGSQ